MCLIKNEVYSSEALLRLDLLTFSKSNLAQTPYLCVTKNGSITKINLFQKICFVVGGWLHIIKNRTSLECIDKALVNICKINEKNLDLSQLELIRLIAIKANLIHKINSNDCTSNLKENKNIYQFIDTLKARKEVERKPLLKISTTDIKQKNNMKGLFYKYLIDAALSNKRINDNIQECKNYSLFQKIKLGAWVGALSPAFGYIPAYLTVGAFLGMTLYTQSVDTPKFVLEAIVVPILIETAYRVILQNGVSLLQDAAIAVVPEKIGNHRVFKYLTSTSCRIVSCHTLFTLGLLTNDEPPSLFQILDIAIAPKEAMLYESTGNILAPLASHMTHNALAFASATVLNSLGL